MPQKAHLQIMIKDKTRRLQKLKEQQAREGQSTEPKILLEIEDLERELETLQEEYDNLPDVEEPEPASYMGDATQSSSGQEGSRQGGIHFGDQAQVKGDVFTGGKRVINTGGGDYVEGTVNTGGGDFVGRDKITYGGADADAIAKAFTELYQALEQKPDTMQKNMAEQALETLEEEAKKGNEADEEKVKQGFEVILAMLPDIGEVAINTFINPIQGISTVFQKIAKKAKEGSKS